MRRSRVSFLGDEPCAFEGIPVLVGGGDWLYVTPGLGALAGKRINVQAEIRLPAHRSLSDRQLDSPAVFQLGMSRTF
jgi:hypothetical protein